MLKTAISATIAVVLATSAHAHVALWDSGMFGLNWPNQVADTTQNYNTDAAVNPLRRSDTLKTADWFAHGFKAFPPAEGEFMVLESGGEYTGELSCNRAFTTLRDPRINMTALEYYACPDIGPLHQMNPFNAPTNISWFGGTSLAIAYTSDIDALQPSDMTVISVNYTSVWTRETVYAIPRGLPKCPEGGCLCTWNWIHQSGHGEGYGDEIYNVLYRCTVTGDIDAWNVVVVGGGFLPNYCENVPSDCTTGPKVPMYLYQVDGNNMPELPSGPPTYNARYGFSDGAQTDLFGASTSVPHNRLAASPTSPPIATTITSTTTDVAISTEVVAVEIAASAIPYSAGPSKRPKACKRRRSTFRS